MNIIELMYNTCASLGRSFGFGALEGAVIYGGILALVFIKGVDMINKEKKKKEKC